MNAPQEASWAARYLQAYKAKTGRAPRLAERLDPRATAGGDVDVLYPVGGGMYAHIHPSRGALVYTPVEPPLGPGEEDALAAARAAVLDAAARSPARPGEAAEERARRLLDGAVAPRARAKGGLADPGQAERLRARLLRDMLHHGPLEVLMRDPYVEDLHVVGRRDVFVVHRLFHMLRVEMEFPDDAALDVFVRGLSERVGRPVSDARPLVDATLRDGSRITIAYSSDVSRKGPSFSVRRASVQPPTVLDLIAWNTLSALEAAYLWLCLEHGLSAFVCGEAASGKTTTLNALLAFVDPRSKVFTAEDTPEVRPPHTAWQRLLTRDAGPEEARVTMFDLLRAALRSRPNLIVVGEIRGAEGNVAFQAMQTGHPTLATFHASNRTKMVQRLTSEPINVPLAFLDNLNLAVFQTAYHADGRLRRRVTGIEEIEGYSPHEGGVVTRTVFEYRASADEHAFKGMNNSFLLERRIAPRLGLSDPRAVYRELERRRAVLEGLMRRGPLSQEELVRALHRGGSA